METAKQKAHTFMMFQGQAEEAMNFYASVFPDARVLSISRYGAGEGGPEGTVAMARFWLMGQELMVIDSGIKHEFTFTPAISFYVKCGAESEIDRCFTQLSDRGFVMMPLAAYPFSKRFAWVADRFGVSWQLSLEG